MGLGIVCFIGSLVVSIICFLLYISGTNRARQTERAEGLSTHKVKNGTITMGGIFFIVIPCTSISFLILQKVITYNNKLLLVLLSFFLLGIVGFIDDYLKIIRKKNEGLNPQLKLILQISVATLLFALYVYYGYDTHIHFNSYTIDFKSLYGMLILLYIVGYSNAVNLTDGIDGLSGGVSVIVLLALLVIAISKSQEEVALFIVIVLASLIAYLLFNWPKAFLFMGDTGSLALGGLVAMLSIVLHEEMLFIIFSIPFIIETLSVMLQVMYYKMTRKRLFKMAPFHHHLELCGLKEKQVLYVFYSIAIISCLLGLWIGGFI